MAFADKLRAYRKDSDLKQKELADKIGVSQKAISSWEVGRSEPTMKEISKLCKVFDCTVEDLTDTRRRKIGEISIDDIVVKVDSMNIEELKKIDYHIKSRIDLLVEQERVQKEKADLMVQLAELEREIEKLKAKEVNKP